MRQLEIKKKIEENNKIIENLITPDIFSLDTTIAELLDEIRYLQNQCEHVFENGSCIYCMKGEEKE